MYIVTFAGWKVSNLGTCISVVNEDPPLGSQGVMNFVSRQHICSCLATVREVSSVLYDPVKDFIHLKKLTA